MNVSISEDRIDAVVALLTLLASKDLTARGVPTAPEDDIDAIIMGINMLAQELTASRDELDRKLQQWWP